MTAPKIAFDLSNGEDFTSVVEYRREGDSVLITGVWSGSSSTTATTASALKTPALADIERAAKAIESMPPEPFGEFMRRKGFDPSAWIMVLPQSIVGSNDFPALLPDYVRVSELVKEPVFIARTTLNFGARR